MNRYMENRVFGIVELNMSLNGGVRGGTTFDRRALRKAWQRNIWLLLRA